MKEALRRIRYVLHLRCDEASRLTSDSLDRPLLGYEKVALAGHRFVCKSCRMLERQLRDLRDACRQGSQADKVAATDDGLGKESKDRLINAIRNQDG